MSLAIEELDAFIALVYARGAYGCRSGDYDVLWNVNWGLVFSLIPGLETDFVKL